MIFLTCSRLAEGLSKTEVNFFAFWCQYKRAKINSSRRAYLTTKYTSDYALPVILQHLLLIFIQPIILPIL